MLTVKDLTLHYKQSQILNGVSLSANEDLRLLEIGRAHV